MAEPTNIDPFDPASLRMPDDYTETVGVRKLLTTVPVRKPDKSWWVRTHPSEDYRLTTGLLELKEEREMYLVAPALWGDLATEPTFAKRLLITAINRQGVLFLWPLVLPDPSGRSNRWHESALDAANRAKGHWLRMAANMSLSAYDVSIANVTTEPDWPDYSLRDLLEVAFRGRLIDDINHPVLRQLRGEA